MSATKSVAVSMCEDTTAISTLLARKPAWRRMNSSGAIRLGRLRPAPGVILIAHRPRRVAGFAGAAQIFAAIIPRIAVDVINLCRRRLAAEFTKGIDRELLLSQLLPGCTLVGAVVMLWSRGLHRLAAHAFTISSAGINRFPRHRGSVQGKMRPNRTAATTACMRLVASSLTMLRLR